MDELLHSLAQAGTLTPNLSLLDAVAGLGLSFALSLVLAWVYRYTHRTATYSQGYVHTLVIMTTVVSLIMLVIGSNLARAFTLVGALSVVRFRNAMKETRDIGFIFMGLSIGMAVGTGFYPLAVLATAMLGGFVIILHKLDLFAKPRGERILRVQIPTELDPEQVLGDALRELVDEPRLLAVETVRAGALQEVTYSVVLKRNTTVQALLTAVRARNAGQKAMLILADHEDDG